MVLTMGEARRLSNKKLGRRSPYRAGRLSVRWSAAIHLSMVAGFQSPLAWGEDGALPKLAVASAPWSALGPHGTRSHWSLVGMSGHGRRVAIAGHRRFDPTTSDGRAVLDRVRIARGAHSLSALAR